MRTGTQDSGANQPTEQSLDQVGSGPQDFDLVEVEQAAMRAAGVPLELLPPISAARAEEGHSCPGGFGV